MILLKHCFGMCWESDNYIRQYSLAACQQHTGSALANMKHAQMPSLDNHWIISRYFLPFPSRKVAKKSKSDAAVATSPHFSKQIEET